MQQPDDSAALVAQLGRRPVGRWSVAARCAAGHPCVIRCEPLVRQGGRVRPFPTLYWLTCRSLRAAVSDLERRGVLAELRERLAQDADFAELVRQDHARYIAQRWEALRLEDRPLVLATPALQRALCHRGVGGSVDPLAVKCLHMHLAHELAAGNVIGRWLVERYGLGRCGGATLEIGN